MELRFFFSIASLQIFTGRNEVLAKVIFLHLSVILFTGGGVWSRGVSNFSGGLQFFGGGVVGVMVRTRHRNTVNVRPVRILLECILVLKLRCDQIHNRYSNAI